jgi:hypothetical protein
MPPMNIVAEIHSVNQSLLEITTKLTALEKTLCNKITIPDIFNDTQKFIITAFLNGYIGSKEIVEFGTLQNKKLSFDHVQYHIRVLKDTFNVSRRSQLLRKFILTFLVY